FAVGLAAQVAIPLPFTPVPLTGQTFAVLLTAAALGMWRGVASMSLYAVAGLAGVPWFAEGSSAFKAGALTGGTQRKGQTGGRQGGGGQGG
ncbi:MAG: hypothetical protein HGA79_09360, partial [Anaerolineales bacterium]|nr:hypothetical protein [Anaerolineales bacterium]